MPPYQNKSSHDMHALMQQLHTLNAAHAPDRLEFTNPFAGMGKAGTDAGNAMYKKGNDYLNSRASEEQVILHEFSKKDELKQLTDMTSLLGSNEIRAENKHLLEIMLTSAKLKPVIMQKWYPTGISQELQKQIFQDMKLAKAK